MINAMRFHILGLPHTVSSKEFNACAYTQKVVKFGKMMTERGHTVIHYGHEDSNLICTEHVPVLRNEDWKIAYGTHNWREKFFKFDTNDHAYQTFYKNAIEEVGKRKQKNDFILPFWGHGVRPICDAHENDMIVVEPGIGYSGGIWAKWKVFESYAIYHAYCGLNSSAYCQQNWYDVVIPNYFDLEEFDYSEEKDDYFLYLGRVYDGKGVNIAIQATERAGVKLVVAGQKEEGYTLPPHVEYVGYADINLRKKLMRRAKASFLPSQYVEPFGGVQIENLLSGTPTITTDWGAFAENNLHGITGYRCRTMGDFVEAIHNIYKINPKNCRSWGENFSLEKIAPMYEKFFQDILNVHTNEGWYELNQRDSIDCLEKEYSFLPPRCNYEGIKEEETPFAKRLSEWIKNNYSGKKIIDIGCGPGLYVDEMVNLGLDAMGYEPDTRSLNYSKNVRNKSLFDVEDPSDLVVFMEVAEHISSEHNDEIVKSIAKNMKDDAVLIWTAAKPGQGGDGHINCQTREYWLEKLEAAGLTYDKECEESLLIYIKEGSHMGWFVNNLIVMRKKTKSKNVVFFIEPEWSYGRVHYDLTRYLSKSGLSCQVLPWNKSYTIEEMKELDACVSTFVTTPHGWKFLQQYNISPEKCVVVAHSRIDLVELIESHGTNEFDKFKEFGCLNEWLISLSQDYGIKRKPKLMPVGVCYETFSNNVSKKLLTVGFASSYHEKEEEISISQEKNYKSLQPKTFKRGWLVKKAVEEAGLEFKVANSYHNSFVTMPGFYNSVDAIICASTEEGCCMPTMEAAASGKLVITTPVGNAYEVLKEGFNNNLIVPFDESQFLERVVELLSFYKNNEEAYRKTCNSLREEMRKFDWKEISKYWFNLLR